MRFSCGSLRSAEARRFRAVAGLQAALSAASRARCTSARISRVHICAPKARARPPQHQQQPRRRHGAASTCGAAWSKYAGVFSKTNRPHRLERRPARLVALGVPCGGRPRRSHPRRARRSPSKKCTSPPCARNAVSTSALRMRPSAAPMLTTPGRRSVLVGVHARRRCCGAIRSGTWRRARESGSGGIVQRRDVVAHLRCCRRVRWLWTSSSRRARGMQARTQPRRTTRLRQRKMDGRRPHPKSGGGGDGTRSANCAGADGGADGGAEGIGGGGAAVGLVDVVAWWRRPGAGGGCASSASRLQRAVPGGEAGLSPAPLATTRRSDC